MVKKYKKFAEDIGLVGIANLLSNFKNLLLVPLLTKCIGLNDYGAWSQFKTTLLLLVPFVTFGVHNSLVRFLAGQENKRDISRDFYSSLFLSLINGLIFAIIFFVLSGLLSQWIFRSNNYITMVKLLGVILIPESLSLLLLEYLKTFRHMRLYFITIFMEITSELLLILFAIAKGYGIIGVIISILIIRVLFVLIRYKRLYSEIGFDLPAVKFIKRNIIYGLPLTISYIFFFVLNSGDRYVINYYLGLHYVSIYSVAYSLAYIVVLVTAPIGYILYPTLSAMYNNGNYKEASAYIKYCSKYIIIIGMFFVWMILGSSRQLILMLSTQEFLPATIIMPLLLAGMFIFQIAIINEYSIILFNRTGLVMILHLILAIINIGLNIIIVPYMGMMGAAVVTLLTFIIFAFFTIIYSQRFIKFEFDFVATGKSIIAAIVIFAIFLFLNPQSVIKIFSLMIATAVVYLVLLFVLRTFEDKEILLFKNIIKSVYENIRPHKV